MDHLEELLRKHKQERKDLQAKIQALKKTATKGDKKKKKEVQEDIAKLENELDDRQSREERELKEGLSKTVVEDEESTKIDTDDTVPDQIPRKTKAQKRRDKKQAENQERNERIKAQEVENLQGPRHKEIHTITEILKKRGLTIFTIPADGNCLYSAIEHQLKQAGELKVIHDYKALRKLTADHLRSHSEDFLPFLSNSNSGEMMSEKDYEEYCLKVEKTTAWGGQIELRALSNVLQHPIEVVQATGPPLVIGEEFSSSGSPLIVTFHRFMYRLGEHYNSVSPYTNGEDDERDFNE